VVLRLGHGQVVVHLTDDVGRPVTDGVLLSRSLDTGAVRRQLVLAPDGVTNLDLPAGGWELTLEVAGRGRSSAAKLDVRDAPLDVRLSLEVSVTVRGTVRDAQGKLPVQNARVQATTGEVNGFRVSVMTDARGEFVLPPVPRTSTLVVAHDAYRPAWRPAAEGDRWDPELTLLPQADTRPAAQQFEGVGMVLDPNSDRGGLVTMVNEGGPAERAGVQRGDLIIAIEGQSVVGLGLEEIVRRIRGPSGTEVHLTFLRVGQTFDLTVRRKLLTL
jgi:PDZ domain/Carboxypeptidase regulatory-like domain